MSAIVVCLDCPNYRNGGWCRLKNKDTGALTDKQMVDLLREHGWTVTCEKYEKVEMIRFRMGWLIFSICINISKKNDNL